MRGQYGLEDAVMDDGRPRVTCVRAAGQSTLIVPSNTEYDHMALTRISITLPRDVLAAADRRARALDRSRSWLIVDAIRAYLAGSPSQVPEPAATPYGVTSPGLGPLRLAQLESDLRLTPERRIRAADDTARLGGRLRGTRGRPPRIASLDRYKETATSKWQEHASP